MEAWRKRTCVSEDLGEGAWYVRGKVSCYCSVCFNHAHLGPVQLPAVKEEEEEDSQRERRGKKKAMTFLLKLGYGNLSSLEREREGI